MTEDTIREALQNHDRRIDDHEKDITALKINHGKNEISIGHLIDTIEDLSSWIKTFIIGAFSTLFTVTGSGIAFIIWYIQKG